MSTEHLRVETSDGITTLTIDRNDRRNALHGPLWTAIGEAARSLTESPPKAVIITGANGHFSAGMDLKPDNPLLPRLATAMQNKDANAFRELITELKGAVNALAAIPCPIIAAIDGACAGGGLEVALACDFRIASEGAFFSMPEARVGMMPDVGGTIRLMRLIGRSRAAELILTNERIDAYAALSLGLINRVTRASSSLDEARSFAKLLMSSAPTSTKEVLGIIRAANPSFEDETEAGIRVLCAGDALEGVASFMEKRPPRWTESE